MNHLQKAWLKALGPVVNLVNEKVAKRSGVIGKLGRFFSFGPRQFGYHPTNRFLAAVNNMLMQHIGLTLHRYSFVKNLNENGYISQRPYAILSMMGIVVIAATMIFVTIPDDFKNEQGTSLQMFTNRGMPAHYSSLNDRVSAHYTEINSIYHWQMLKRADERAKEIQRNRIGQNDKTKKTKFTRKGYDYIEAHSKAQ